MGHQQRASNLSGLRVALVYSFEAPSDPPGRWYDRWRTRVVMSYGEALERLSVRPYFCDIDTFCRQVSDNSLPGIDAVISLNAGVRPVSHFGLVPAVALWRGYPTIPSEADVILCGERKDVATLLAAESGLSVARSLFAKDAALLSKETTVIIKPRDLGGSFGLQVKTVGELQSDDFSVESIVQEFVEGYDVTVPVFFDAARGCLRADSGVLYQPQTDDPRRWVYDRKAKEAYVGGADDVPVNRIPMMISPDVEALIVKYCQQLGITCFARCDFRWAQDEPDFQGAQITNEGLYFIEVNPLPTICVGLAFVEGVRASIERDVSLQARMRGAGLDVRNDYDVIALVLQQSLTRVLHPSEVNNRDKPS